MKLGIIGLPNVGKSTLFNALTGSSAPSESYAFCTVEPNVGAVPVPDPRLDALTVMFKSAKTVPTYVEFVDIAGLAKGASRGEGLGNKFLSHIREAEALVHVVRCFEDPAADSAGGGADPIGDLEVINMELIYADLEVLERRAEKARKMLKGDKSYEIELHAVEKLIAELNDGKSARAVPLDAREAEIAATIPLLSAKKVIYVANIPESAAADPNYESSDPGYAALRAHAQAEGAALLPICAGIEAQIMALDPAERDEFRRELGVGASGLDRLIAAGYALLGYISFLTAGPKESRAWTITEGTKAPGAAGKIHSDLERGFIRAEVVAFADLERLGGMTAAKAAGLVRSEGKEYVIRDGDVVLFRFNV